MHIESIKHKTGLRWIVNNDDGSRYSVATSPRMGADGRFITSGIVDAFDTQADAKAVMQEAQDYQRFVQLRDWLVGLECHRGCAIHLAFNAVEGERGRLKKNSAKPCDFCPAEPPHMECDEIIRAHWKVRPPGRLEPIPASPSAKAA